MNLIEKLLKIDSGKVDEPTTKIIKSTRLAQLLGEKDPINITIRSIPYRRLNDILALQFNKKGELDINKSSKSNILIVVDGIVTPDLKNQDLMDHFNCATPADLVEKLFDNEISTIADAILTISNIKNTEEIEEEIKN